MNNDNSSNYLKLLKQISSNSEIIDKLEEFLSEMSKRNLKAKDLPHGGYYLYQDVISKALYLAKELSDKYGINHNAFLIYFNMDKEVFGNIPEQRRYSLGSPIRITTAKADFFLSGETISKAFTSNNTPVVNFLISNKEYLPLSTQKYIQRKAKSVNNDCKLPLEVKNDFHFKILLTNMPVEFDINILRPHFQLLKGEDNNRISQEALDLIYYSKALYLKYSKSSNEGFDKFYITVNNAIFNKFKKIYSTSQYSRSKDDFYSVFELILKSDNVKDYFYLKVKETNNLAMSSLFSKYATSDIQKEAIIETMKHNLQANMKKSFLPFENCSNELQEALLKEILEQDYKIDFEEINKNISI